MAYDENVKAGMANTVNFTAGNSTSGMLFYQLKVGDKAVRGVCATITASNGLRLPFFAASSLFRSTHS